MNPTVTNLVGVDELGCGVVPIPNGTPGQVMQLDPTSGLPVWGPGEPGGPTMVATTFVAGVLTVTVNGVAASATLQGQLLEDAFGVDLGYLLPLT
jgi:hypothetical protein